MDTDQKDSDGQLDFDLMNSPLSSIDAINTITLTSGTPTYTISNGPTLSADWSNTSVWASSPMISRSNGSIELTGEEADIKINGVSLTDTLKGIQDRLNILRPNVELESKWDQLRDLREQYERLENELKEKQKMWDTLSSMPPVEIKK